MPMTTLPTPPSRADSATFAARGDAFMASLPGFVTEANTLQTDVSTKQTTASAAATTATTKAAEASTSASSAATANTNAGIARDAAVVARTAAEASYDSFDDRYLGPKAAAPTLDNDGAALLVGALYWDTTIPGMRAYTGTVWTTLPAATAGSVANTPAGNIAATTVQGALNELDAEKALAAGSTLQDFSVATLNATLPLHLNDIINGDFRIAQAGTSFAAPVDSAYDLDGWLNGNNTTAVFTVAQVAGSTAGRLARQVTITTADAAVAIGEVVLDVTRIEGSNIEKYVGQTFTVAFRARVPVAGIHCVALRNAGNDRSYVVEINFPTANAYQNCSFTVVGGLPTAGTWNYTNGSGISVAFTHMAGTSFHTTPNAWQTGQFLATANQVNDCATVGNVWAMEKVTMNLGTVAAVSEISVEQELIRCQRYYEVARIFTTGADATNAAIHGVAGAYAVKKRAAPTVVAVDDAGTTGTWANLNGGASITAVSPVFGGNEFPYQSGVVTGSTAGYRYFGFIRASARL